MNFANWSQIVAKERCDRMIDLSSASMKSPDISRIHDGTKEDREKVTDQR